MLQLSLSEGASAVSVQISGTDYTIDLAAGVQRNTATGFERPLREVCLDEDEESDEDEPDGSSGFSTRPQGSSTDAWTHANTLMMSTWISRDRYEFTGTGHCSPLFFSFPHTLATQAWDNHISGKENSNEESVLCSVPGLIKVEEVRNSKLRRRYAAYKEQLVSRSQGVRADGNETLVFHGW